MTTHSRAKKGGEIGANGEWYEGGKFIATTDHAKKLGSNKVKPTGRREVDRGVWEMQPFPGARAIYAMLGGFEIRELRGSGPFKLNTDLRGEWATTENLAKREDLIARFNRGERWLA